MRNGEGDLKGFVLGGGARGEFELKAGLDHFLAVGFGDAGSGHFVDGGKGLVKAGDQGRSGMRPYRGEEGGEGGEVGGVGEFGVREWDVLGREVGLEKGKELAEEVPP